MCRAHIFHQTSAYRLSDLSHVSPRYWDEQSKFAASFRLRLVLCKAGSTPLSPSV